MQEAADGELLERYARGGSNDAFAALVTRYVNLVYSVALRKTGSPEAAEEVTQVVFIVLARKADGLRGRAVLSGWLYHTARLAAVNFLRVEARRARREQESYMQSLANEPEAEVWSRITPLLEDAMGVLGEHDRNALVLRFFEGKSFEQVAKEVGATENGAKKRVQHGLEKLRRYFAKRGVVSTGSAISGALATYSIQAAPVALAQSITAAAVAKGAAAGASTLVLVKATLKALLWAKMKHAVGIGLGVVVTAGALTLVVTSYRAPPPTGPGWPGEEFRVRGIAKMMMYMPSGATQAQPTVFFDMNVAGPRWSVRFTRDEGADNPYAADYEEASFDGVDMYYLGNFRSAAEWKRRNGGTLAPNIANAHAYTGEVFNERVADEIGAIWLAYASGSYFQTRTNDFVEPAMAFDAVGHQFGPPKHQMTRARWALSETKPQIPTRVEYLNDGFADSPRGPVKLPAPYDGGFTAASYQVESFTNVGGLAVPAASTLKLLMPKPGGSTNTDLKVLAEYRTTLTNFTRGAGSKGFRPELPGPTAINDWREGSLHYFATNAWPSVAELRQGPRFERLRRLNAASMRYEHSTRSPVLVRVLLGLMIGLPAAYLTGNRLYRGGR